MRIIKVSAAALILGSIPTAAVAQSKVAAYDCSKMRIVKPSKIRDTAQTIINFGCSIFKKCDANIATGIIIGGDVVDGLINNSNAKTAARENQECLAIAAQESLKIGEPLTVALEGGAIGTVEGSVVLGPRREYDLPLINPTLTFADADMSTVAKWHRTKSKRIAIMDSPSGGMQIGTIKKKKEQVFVMGQYGTNRVLIQLDGKIAGYIDRSALEEFDRTNRPEFAEASASRSVKAIMTCIGSNFEFSNAEEGVDTTLSYQCFDPLGNSDFLRPEELGNA